MLDIETKRRIDTARDILVGKVPDPKSQVEQITIALIYKFMDDMDAEAEEEFNGKRKFFTNEFSRYGWAKLMRSGLGGHELLGLYAEGISKMPENPGIPLLFRDIFKNAFLPYRDPETLKAFLKVIDEFTYDHSERLGDAFEYLLSVLGSQGDAGQFRTPRHIIDFIVAIINPTKKDKVLDPACGTAGFLISSYKHILKSNVDANGNSTLTPDDKGRLAKNFQGYDISPDMVRLSLVNLYLHGFTDPHIYEYDTLTSEERWTEYADVILANPPFMSPKGGIKPHKRFSIQAKRSEVLFVDYMAEHLTPTGRAGIIVPEGIIFQSQTAYSELRKMLVENSLVAVISLPAGVFNPYSGVKTSILILDKSLAKEAKTIAFFKIENDGFGLGAQRREIHQNDLPQVRAEVSEYLRRLREREPVEDIQQNFALIVSKEKIAENGDYNLSGDRYRKVGFRTSRYPLVAIQETAEVASGFGFPLEQQGKTGEEIPFLKVSDMNLPGNEVYVTSWNHTVSRTVLRQLGAKSFPKGTVIFPKIGAAIATNKKRILSRESTFDNNVMGIVPGERIMSEFLYALLQSFDLSNWASDSQPPSMRKSIVEAHKFPLPPLGVQKEIVAEIECYQKVIDGARAVVDNYRPHIPIHPDWPVHELSEIIEGKPKNGYSGRPVDRPTSTKVLSLSATTSGKLDLTKFKFLDEDIPPEAECRCRKGDIYLQRGNTAELVGTAALFDVDEPNFVYPDLMIRVQANESKVNRYYLLHALQSQPIREFLRRNAVGAAGSMPKINQSIVERIPIPLPSLEAQKDFIAELESEQALVNVNRELIVRMEKKVHITLARIWGQADQPVAEA